VVRGGPGLRFCSESFTRMGADSADAYAPMRVVRERYAEIAFLASSNWTTPESPGGTVEFVPVPRGAVCGLLPAGGGQVRDLEHELRDFEPTRRAEYVTAPPAAPRWP